MSFCITENLVGNAYGPRVAKTSRGFLVVWTVEGEELRAIHYENKVAQKEWLVSSLKQDDEPHALISIGNDRFVVAIEEYTGTRIIVLDYTGEPKSAHYLPQKGLLLNVFKDHIFMYNKETVSVYQTDFGAENWSKAQLIWSVNIVYSIPQVYKSDNGYFISWLNDSDEIVYMFTDLDGAAEPNTLIEFCVDYLLSAKIGENLLAFSGYSTHERIYRSLVVKIDGENLSKISDRYWKGLDYKDRAFYIASLTNGYLLMTDGPEQSDVCVQRFTRANTFLNYMMPVDNEEEPTSCPEFAQGEGEGLLVYVKDKTDYSQIWGKWIKIGPIPELD